MKTYIITGASSDIGVYFLRRLEQTGESAQAACQYNEHKEQLEQLKKDFKNVEIKLYSCNLASEQNCLHFIEQIRAAGIEPTHILHLPAQKFEYMRIKNFDWQKLATELTIQVNTLAQLMKAFLPQMAKKKYGKIVTVLTAYTIGTPPKFMSDYLITKYALLGLVKSAASEYSGSGITINGISPNMIETKFLEKVDPRTIEINANNSTMKRNVKLEEVTDALMFLLSDASNYITGTNLNMSGGDRM